jgi:hypothetical protein
MTERDRNGSIMPMSQALLPEFDHEMANTRKALERVPEDKFGWKPHQKSMTMGRLATHVAELAGWVPTTLESESFDFAPPGAPPFEPKTAVRAPSFWRCSTRMSQRSTPLLARPPTLS